MPRIVSVLLPMPLPEAFDYAEPEGMHLALGDIVAAPLGPRLLRGVVTGLRDGTGGNRPLKPIAERLDEPPLPPRTLEFVEWAARYAVDAPGQPLAMAIRGLRAPRPKPEKRLRATGRAPARPTPARTRVLEVAGEGLHAAAELARAAGVSSGVVKGLLDEGALEMLLVEPALPFAPPDVERPHPPLNPSQAAAADVLKAMIDDQGFSVALLDGVTGSGKTEVYLEAAARVLSRDPHAQVLVLLPEIALTQAVIDRFERRFGALPAEWHSGVAPPRRRVTWEAVASGEARIVVGARSALFLPFADLKLVIVDEEHDGSYKQEDGFIYQARDLAVARAKIESATIVLASATPSLESLWNAQNGRYRWLRLSDRHGDAELPEIALADLREHPPQAGEWLSPVLTAAMAETLERGEQCLLFLNRRGYAPLVLCQACGEKLKSPDTDSWLVEHRYTGRLVCHLTGFSMPKPDRCPHCTAKDSFVSIGPGVERVEEEARRKFPDARVAVFSSDTAPDAASARALIEAMAAGEIDILVATQAAAKGHNFPNLTLVGVVDADLGLRGGDLRAAERTYQLLAQVSGRAGRHERPGRAILQTWMPDHAVMQALKAGDRDGFVAIEMAEREAAGLPPFGRLAAVIVAGPDPAVVERFVQDLAAAAPNAAGVDVYGPADPPFSLVRGLRRKRFLVRADRNIDLQGFLGAWRARVKVPSSVRMVIDVDPYSFF
ncbi:primosomal protein N' [Caulobacter sp. KR2-114]|uniref:primosomal protein N' n=1 Tax=Caulobacter sp. KR2-114 TaxID=3400912 RepID=UPI003BFFC7B6